MNYAYYSGNLAARFESFADQLVREGIIKKEQADVVRKLAYKEVKQAVQEAIEYDV
jgi:hypothetical protein